jgi:hypothetical protein
MVIKHSVDVGVGQPVEHWKVTGLHVHFDDTVQVDLQGYLSLEAYRASKPLPGARRQVSMPYDESRIGTDFKEQVTALLNSDHEWATGVEVTP